MTTIVEGPTPVPRVWNKFLANSRNKVQLLRFLSKVVIEASSQFTDVVVCSTYDNHVLVNTSDSQSVTDFDTIMPCNHQEADSRIFLHLSHAAHCGCGKACRGNCKCARAGIKCTILCNCEGGCINNDGV